MKQLKKKKEKGISLIVVTGVMLVLSTTAVTFVRLANYERASASNYVADIEAKLTAFAGVDHAIALMYDNIRTKGRIGFREPVGGEVLEYPQASNINLFNASQNGEEISLSENTNLFGRFSISGRVGAKRNGNIFGSYEQDGNFYSLKIEDNSGKLNVNSHISVTLIDQNAAVSFDNLTLDNDNQLNRSNPILFNITTALLESCGVGSQGDRDAIAAFIVLQNSPVGDLRRFNSFEELQDGLEGLTQFTGLAQIVQDRILDNLTTDSFIDITTTSVSNPGREVNQVPLYNRELRAPININTVSVELLTAIIFPLKARCGFFVTLGTGTEADNTTFSSAFITENNIVNAIALYDVGFTNINEARNIANVMITQRDSLGFFLDQGELDNFLTTAVGIDNITIPTIDDVLAGSFAKDSAFMKDETGAGNGTVIISQDAWSQAIRDMLKSNFNPNVMHNFYNPNAGSYRRICKGDLVTRVGTSDLPSHTTELTTFTVGGANITSIGRVTAENGSLVIGVSTVSTTANLARRVTQTTQQDFGNVIDTDQVITSPENITNNRTAPHDLIGAVEPRPLNRGLNRSSVPGNELYYSEPTFADKFNNLGEYIDTPDQWKLTTVNDVKGLFYSTGLSGGFRRGIISGGNGPFIKNRTSLPQIMKAANSIENDQNNLTYDGIVSRKAFYSSNRFNNAIFENRLKERYLIDSSFTNATFNNNNITVSNYLNTVANNDGTFTFTPSGSRTTGEPQVLTPSLRDKNQDTVSNPTTNVANFEGSLEFWVKFDADQLDSNGVGADPKQVAFGLLGATSASGFRTGTVHPDPTVDTNFREGMQMYIYINTLGELRASRLYYGLCYKMVDLNSALGARSQLFPYGALFELDVDKERKTGRRDAVFTNAQGFKAHEWYHISLIWNDRVAGNQSMKLFVNGEQQAQNLEIVDNPAFRDWCVLNEQEPLDSFYINGFPRKQAALGGYFHFDTDVHMVGNATIDELVTFNNENGAVPKKDRFQNVNVLYANTFRDDTSTKRGIVAAVHWTSYPPYREDAAFPRTRISNISTNAENRVVVQSSLQGTGNDRREIVVTNFQTPVTNTDDINYTFNFGSSPAGSPSNSNPIDGAKCSTLDSVTTVILDGYPALINTRIF